MRKGQTRWLGMLLGLFLVAQTGPAQGEEKPAPAPGKKPAPGVEEKARRPGQAEIEAARAAERALKGLKGKARRQAQLRAARAWESAAEAAGADRAAAALARIRQARLLVVVKEYDRAAVAYGQALELAPKKEGPAALLGLGDIARRRRHTKEALGHYRRLVKEFPRGGVSMERALVWVGKLEAGAGRHEEALEALGQVAGATSSVARMTTVYDLMIQVELARGDLAGAKRVLAEGRDALARLGEVSARKARAVQKALERMKGPERIARAAAKGKGEEDGEEKEKGKTGEE